MYEDKYFTNTFFHLSERIQNVILKSMIILEKKSFTIVSALISLRLTQLKMVVMFVATRRIIEITIHDIKTCEQ